MSSLTALCRFACQIRTADRINMPGRPDGTQLVDILGLVLTVGEDAAVARNAEYSRHLRWASEILTAFWKLSSEERRTYSQPVMYPIPSWPHLSQPTGGRHSVQNCSSCSESRLHVRRKTVRLAARGVVSKSCLQRPPCYDMHWASLCCRSDRGTRILRASGALTAFC